MPRYKVTIEYQGTNTAGWQKQKNAASIQEYIEKAIYNFSKENVLVYGAGRTDAGVHALGQVAHFDLIREFDPQIILRATNHFLKNLPVGIVNCKIVDENFHARFSAIRRTYKYKIVNRPAPLIINKNLAWHVSANLDINKMQEAANFLIGKHDFTSFRASECQAKNPIITIDLINIVQNEELIEITVSARSFLHHMVRNIVGTIKMAGEGKICPTQVKNILEARNRTQAGPTAPADGLFLYSVEY
ncbi:MAG: tRNA pseudouridine(38-40) synthase TruA [Sphingobacteriia bacterium]|nr:tRNA pseudouridine(38-40) synthase TruA [Sphingobacteriia bacterium]